MRNVRNYIVIFTFLCITGFFLINQLFRFVPDKEYNENKKKAEKPELNIKKLDYYPKKYEQYLSDNFSLRGFLLSKMSKINTSVWNKSPNPDKIIIGKENWLFSADNELDYYYGKLNFSEKQLKLLLKEFEYRKRILDTMGIEMKIVIHPTKYSIYPEYLPEYLISGNIINPASQLLDYFKLNSNIEIFYSRDFLLSLKDEYQLYYKYDNHWNRIAGYYVAKEMVHWIDRRIPEIPLDEFCRDTILRNKGNLSDMTGNPDDYSESSVDLYLCKNDAQPEQRYINEPPASFPYKDKYQLSFNSNKEALPNALIIRDSYAEALIPYLKNSFHHSTYIWDDWQYKFNLDIIENEKPDIVIYMMLECFLPNIYNEGLTDQNLRR